MEGWQQPPPSWCAAAGHTARLPGNASVLLPRGSLLSLLSFSSVSLCSLTPDCWKQEEMLFNKCSSMRLNVLQLNIGRITKNTRANNQVRGEVQWALCAASTWPESFVVSALSLFFVIVPQHLWFICYFLPCFARWGWYCEAVSEVKHHPSLRGCQYRQGPVASGERTNSGQGRQPLNS